MTPEEAEHQAMTFRAYADLFCIAGLSVAAMLEARAWWIMRKANRER